MHKKGFRLDQVLNYRKEMEKVHKLEFAEAKEELENASSRLKSEEETVERLSSEFNGRQQEGITGLELQMYSLFFRRKRSDIREQRTKVGLLDQVATVKHESLMEASKDKRMLETLEKKSSLVRQREIAEKERSLLEEIALRGKGAKY